MDLICLRCSEPWAVDHVIHDQPEDFVRKGGNIYRCPACPKEKPKLDKETRSKLAIAQALGDVLGDDIDGMAAELEDLGLT